LLALSIDCPVARAPLTTHISVLFAQAWDRHWDDSSWSLARGPVVRMNGHRAGGAIARDR
jgi:hypothetical protein